MAFAGRCICAALWVLGLGFAPSNSNAKLMLIAHRGASPNAPENTLAAFHRTKVVADFVEYDVMPTRDGQLVVIHDGTVDRTTNGKGAVADFTLAQIRQLDAGSWLSQEYRGEKIPTAEEALAAIQTDAAPFMERKGGTVDQFVALLNRQPLRPEGIVMSFDYAFVVALKQARPEVHVGWIGAGPLTGDQIVQAAADGITHFVWTAPDLDAGLVRAIHEVGGLVLAWTVNDLAVASALNDLEVDGIITDRAADFAPTAVFDSPVGTECVQPPNHAVLRLGRSGVLTSAAPVHARRHVEWRRAGGSQVIGTGSRLRLDTANPQSFGRYEARWVHEGESVAQEYLVSAGHADNQLVNISARMTMGTGEATGIVGFVVKSEHAPRFMLRAVGPSLGPLGVVDPAANPTLTLLHRGQVIDSAMMDSRILANTADFARNGAFPFSAPSGDVAIMRDLKGGAYTVHVSTGSGPPRTGLIEVYQDHTSSNWAAGAAVNLSLRGRAVRGSPLIAGFVVPDGNSQTMLVRGIGPSLVQSGIIEPLRDPSLRLFNSSHVIVAENDDWWSEGDSAVVEQVATQVGAFRIAAGREAAVLVTLAPGAYSAVLTDACGERDGVGLLEIYAVDLGE